MLPADTTSEQKDFRQLADYARFLLVYHLRDFCAFVLQTSREVDMPLLRYFEAMPEEQLLAMSMESNAKLFKAVIEGRAAEHIAESTKAWQQNRLPIIQGSDVVIEDVSKANFVRRQAFRHFLKNYSSDLNTYVAVMEEADRLTLLQEDISYKTLFQIKEELILEQHHESERRAERLKELEEASRELINNAPEAIVVIDTESRILLWNPKAVSTFGWTPEEIGGRKITETIIPPAYRQAHLEGIHRLHRTGESRVLNKTIEVEALRKTGEAFFISLTISRSMRAGSVVYIAFIRDITEEKATALKLEEQRSQLAEKNKALERSNQELTSFNYIASHDLSEPVRKIRLFSNIIQKKSEGASLSPDMRAAMRRIESSADHLERLIEALVVFSRASAGGQRFESVSLGEIVAAVSATLKERMAELNASVTCGPLPAVMGLRFLLHQLFENLIGNALKYSRPGVPPRIDITAALMPGSSMEALGADPSTQYHSISVADNGIGFEQQYAAKVFEVFQRLHGRKEYSGTGIGLAICKKVAQQHNGFIDVTSTPGAGSTFTVYLPQVPEQ